MTNSLSLFDITGELLIIDSSKSGCSSEDDSTSSAACLGSDILVLFFDDWPLPIRNIRTKAGNARARNSAKENQITPYRVKVL